jgi:hypothetical protein
MVKKGLFALVLAVLIAGGIFAQDADAVHKHEPFDMLVGLDLGMGITPSLTNLLDANGIPQGNYAFFVDLGLTYDFYLFNWLSFNTGLFFHPDVYLILDQDLNTVTSFTDVAATPLCLTIPFAAHINIPQVEWIYAGIGLNLNIPIAGMLDGLGIPIKGDFFAGLPIDIGFDFIKAGKGGGRFVIRITPEFHKKGTAVPVGFMWQIYNWKIYGK